MASPGQKSTPGGRLGWWRRGVPEVPAQLVRKLRYGGTAGDRNVYLMSDRSAQSYQPEPLAT